MRRDSWLTKFGFYFAAVGSAFGLGNLWRFPYVVGDSGGGAFVWLYVFAAIFIGFPLLAAELILGKTTSKNIVSAIEEVETARVSSALHRYRSLLPWAGRLALFSCLVLLSYYSVISSWVLFFLVQSLISVLGINLPPQVAFEYLMNHGWLQLGLTAAHIGVCAVFVSRGVEEGIEKCLGYIMPIFGVLMVYLAVKALGLPSAPQALRFLLYPDFSQLSPATLIRVIGHVLFTLSIGLGAMVAFGSYLREDVHVPTAGLRLTSLDIVLSLFAGFVIFPIVFMGDAGKTSFNVLFESVPYLMSKIGLGQYFSIVFFLCLYLAALGSSIGLMETLVANLTERRKQTRSKAAIGVGLLVLALSPLSAFSSSYLKGVQLHGIGVMELVDHIIIQWFMPLSAIGISILTGYKMKIKVLRKEFGDDPHFSRLFANWIFFLRWVVPLVISGALFIEVVGWFF